MPKLFARTHSGPDNAVSCPASTYSWRSGCPQLLRIAATAAIISVVLVAADTPPPPAPPPLGSGSMRAKVYKSLIPPLIMDHMFGHALSKEYLAIQVTVVNQSLDFDMLIRDISVNEINQADCHDRGMARAPSSKTGNQQAELPKIVEDAMRKVLKDIPKLGEGEVNKMVAHTTEEPSGVARTQTKCKSSSHELSNLRGAAERGMSEDPRNRYIRGLEFVGIIGGGLVGAAGLGPVLPRAVAAFTGSFIPANEKLFPDYTIGQLNRLNDSAYAANTLVGKNRAKVVVVFIPLTSILNREDIKPFREDPFKYIAGDATHPGLNQLGISVDYTHVVSLDEIKPVITSVVMSKDQAKNLLTKADATGYILGQFLDGADIAVANGDDLGLKIEIDKTRTSSDNRLYFVLKPSKAIAPNTRIDLDVVRPKNKASFSFIPDMPAAPVSLLSVAPATADSFAAGADVQAKFVGDNFYDLGLKINVTPPTADAGSIVVSSIAIVDPKNLTATLGLKDAKAGMWKLTVTVNGVTSGEVQIEVK